MRRKLDRAKSSASNPETNGINCKSISSSNIYSSRFFRHPADDSVLDQPHHRKQGHADLSEVPAMLLLQAKRRVYNQQLHYT